MNAVNLEARIAEDAPATSRYESIEQWAAAGKLVADGHSNHQFVLGAWMAEGLRAFPEKSVYKEAQRVTGLTRGTLHNVAWVYKATLSLRGETAMSSLDLTWNHYKALAALEPDEQREWLKRVVDKKMSARDLAKATASYVTLEWNAPDLRLTAGSFSVVFNVKDWHDFRPIEPTPETNDGTFYLKALNDVLKRVEYAVPNVEGLRKIPVAQLEIAKGKLKAVATDAHRIAITTIPTDISDRTLLIQKDAFRLIKTLPGEMAKFKEQDSNYFFQTDTTTLVVRKPQMKFPGYRSVFDRSGPVVAEFTVLACDLRDAIARASAMVDDQIPGVTFRYRVGDYSGPNIVHDCFEVTYDSEGRATTDTIGVISKRVLTDAVIDATFNIDAYSLADFLAHAEGELTISWLGDPRKPVWFTNGDYQYLVMPVFPAASTGTTAVSTTAVGPEGAPR